MRKSRVKSRVFEILEGRVHLVRQITQLLNEVDWKQEKAHVVADEILRDIERYMITDKVTDIEAVFFELGSSCHTLRTNYRTIPPL